MKLPRSSGVLLHPTSLPGRHGIGELGSEARQFLDHLAQGGQRVWQILPLGPTGYGDSPYSAFSAFAGNPLLISLDLLVAVGDLEASDLPAAPLPEGTIDYGAVHRLKDDLLHRAATRFFDHTRAERRADYDHFCRDAATWLDDYALFRSLRHHFGERPWTEWPAELRDREPGALRQAAQEFQEAVDREKYIQFTFFSQWQALKGEANARRIRILGDMPIFVADDSAEVWAGRELFDLDATGRPHRVAGVPPDYFSATGQRWGNPLYRWYDRTEAVFAWWEERLGWWLRHCDLLRIDHFRGFEACWSIPAGEPTAIHGEWVTVPGAALFARLQSRFGDLPLVAEDLGIITPPVEELRDRFGFPGMKILQFAFGSGAANPYLPHNYPRNCVVYTGTHDNDTLRGWFKALDTATRRAVCGYVGGEHNDIPGDLLRLAMASVADLCIVPLQDLLGMGTAARMNTPGLSDGNWRWRWHSDQPLDAAMFELAELTATYGRDS